MPVQTTPPGWPHWLGLLHQRRGRRRRFGQPASTDIAPQLPLAYYLALLIIAIITLACFNMAFAMADGLPANPDLTSRLHYLATRTTWWQFGWLTWMASAIGLLTFCILLATYIPPSPLRILGISLVMIGIGPDISAEMIYAFVLPDIQDTQMFVLIDRIAMLLTGFVGNGAYCLGGLLLNLALFKNTALSRAMLAFGLPSWLIGLLISVSAARNDIPTATIFTALAMVWNVLWMFWFTQTVFRQQQPVSCHVFH